MIKNIVCFSVNFFKNRMPHWWCRFITYVWVISGMWEKDLCHSITPTFRLNDTIKNILNQKGCFIFTINKSGTHWIRLLLSHYINLYYDYGHDEKLKELILKICTNLKQKPKKGLLHTPLFIEHINMVNYPEISFCQGKKY